MYYINTVVKRIITSIVILIFIKVSLSLSFLHYNYFITNALTRAKSEDYLRSYDSDTAEFEAVGAKAIPGSVSLTVGVLF